MDTSSFDSGQYWSSFETEIMQFISHVIAYWESFVTIYFDYHDYTTETLSSLIDAVIEDVGGEYMVGWAILLVYLACLIPNSYDTSHRLPIQDPNISIANVTPLRPAASAGVSNQPYLVLPGRNTVFVWLPVLFACDMMTVWTDVAAHGLAVFALLVAALAFALCALEIYSRFSGSGVRTHRNAGAGLGESLGAAVAAVGTSLLNGTFTAVYTTSCLLVLAVFVLLRDLVILAQIQVNALLRLHYCYFADSRRYHATLTLLAGIRRYRHDYVVEALQSGAFVNYRDEFGRTPLMVATQYNNLEAVDALCSGVYRRPRPRRQWMDGTEGGEGTPDAPGDPRSDIDTDTNTGATGTGTAAPYTELYLDGLDLDGQNCVNLACLYNYLPIVLKLVRYVQQLEESGLGLGGDVEGPQCVGGATAAAFASGCEASETDTGSSESAGAGDPDPDADADADDISLPTSDGDGKGGSGSGSGMHPLLAMLPKELVPFWRGVSGSFAKLKKLMTGWLGMRMDPVAQAQAKSWEAVLRRRQTRVMNLLGGNRNYISYSNHVIDVVSAVLFEHMVGYLSIIAYSGEAGAGVGVGVRRPALLSLHSLTHHVSPLYICCRHGYCELMFIILNCLTSGSVAVGSGSSAQGRVGEEGGGTGLRSKMEIVRSVKCFDRRGNNILLWCVSQSSLLNVEHLLSHCLPAHVLLEYLQSTDHAGRSPVVLACARDWREGLRLLVRFGASLEDVAAVGGYPPASKHRGGLLHYCVRRGCLGAVRYLLEEAGLPADTVDARNGHNALLAAVAHRHSHIARYLLEHGHCSLDDDCCILQRLSLTDGDGGGEGTTGSPPASGLLQLQSGESVPGSSLGSVVSSPGVVGGGEPDTHTGGSSSPLPPRSGSGLGSAPTSVRSGSGSIDAGSGGSPPMPSTPTHPSPFLHNRRTHVAAPARSPMLSKYPSVPVLSAEAVAAGLAAPAVGARSQDALQSASHKSAGKHSRSRIKPSSRIQSGSEVVLVATSPPASGGIAAAALRELEPPPTEADLAHQYFKDSSGAELPVGVPAVVGRPPLDRTTPLPTPPLSQQTGAVEAEEPETDTECDPPLPDSGRAETGGVASADSGAGVELGPSGGVVACEEVVAAVATATPGCCVDTVTGANVQPAEFAETVESKASSALVAISDADADADADVDSGSDCDSVESAAGLQLVERGVSADDDEDEVSVLPLSSVRVRAGDKLSSHRPTLPWPLSAVWAVLEALFGAYVVMLYTAVVAPLLAVVYGYVSGTAFAGTAGRGGGRFADLYPRGAGPGSLLGGGSGATAKSGSWSESVRVRARGSYMATVGAEALVLASENTDLEMMQLLLRHASDPSAMAGHAGAPVSAPGVHNDAGAGDGTEELPHVPGVMAHDGYSALSLAIINSRTDLLLGVVGALCYASHSQSQSQTYHSDFDSMNSDVCEYSHGTPTSTPLRGGGSSSSSSNGGGGGDSAGVFSTSGHLRAAGTPMHTLPALFRTPRTSAPTAAPMGGYTRNHGIDAVFRLLHKLDSNGLTPLMLCCYNNNLRMMCCVLSALEHYHSVDVRREVSFCEQFPFVHMYPPPVPTGAHAHAHATPTRQSVPSSAYHTAHGHSPYGHGQSVGEEVAARREAEFSLRLETLVNTRSSPLQLTCFMIACLNNCLAIAQCLVERRCDVNAVDASGATAVMLTAALGLVPITKWLICVVRVDIFRVDRRGLTVLMHACKAKQHEIIKLLLSLHPPIAYADIDADRVRVPPKADVAPPAVFSESLPVPNPDVAPASAVVDSEERRPTTLRRTKTSRVLGADVGAANGFSADVHVRVVLLDIMGSMLDRVLQRGGVSGGAGPSDTDTDNVTASGGASAGAAKSPSSLSMVRRRLGVPPIAIGGSSGVLSVGPAGSAPPVVAAEGERKTKTAEGEADAPLSRVSPRHVDFSMHADINHPSPNPSTEAPRVYHNALCVAALGGDLESMRLLMLHGCSVDCVIGERRRLLPGSLVPVKEDVTPLLVAAEAYDLGSDIGCVAFLVSSGGAAVTEEHLSSLRRSRSLLQLRLEKQQHAGSGPRPSAAVERLDRVLELLELHYYLPVAGRVTLTPTATATATSAASNGHTSASRALGTHRLPRYYRLLLLLPVAEARALDLLCLEHLRRAFLRRNGTSTASGTADASARVRATEGVPVISPTNRRLFGHDQGGEDADAGDGNKNKDGGAEHVQERDRDVLFYVYLRLLSCSYAAFERSAEASAGSAALSALSAEGRSYWRDARCICFNQCVFTPVCGDSASASASASSLPQIWSQINAMKYKPPVALARKRSLTATAAGPAEPPVPAPALSRESTFSAIISPLASASNSFYNAFAIGTGSFGGNVAPTDGVGGGAKLTRSGSSMYSAGSSNGSSFRLQDGDQSPDRTARKLRNKRKNEKRRAKAAASAANSPVRAGSGTGSFSRRNTNSSTPKAKAKAGRSPLRPKNKPVAAEGGVEDEDGEEVTTDLFDIMKSLSDMAAAGEAQTKGATQAEGGEARDSISVHEFHCRLLCFLTLRLAAVRGEAVAGAVELGRKQRQRQFEADDLALCYLKFVLGVTQHQLDAYNDGK